MRTFHYASAVDSGLLSRNSYPRVTLSQDAPGHYRPASVGAALAGRSERCCDALDQVLLFDIARAVKS